MDDKKKSIVRSFKQISETGKKNHRIIIFGAGNFGKYACQYCKKIFPETKISFCDNDKDRQWQTLCECEILPPKAATKEYPNAIYIVANDFYAHEMEKQLSLDGIQKNQIYLFGRQDYYSLLSLDEMWQVNQKIYEEITGKFIDKHALKTFTEKMQYSKIYLSNEQKTRLTDKYLVRKWVEEKIGDRYLVPLLNVYDTPDDINFDKLPDSFVLKANHGCEMNLIVPDKRKLNQKQAVEQMWSWMNNNFAYYSFELHYKDIKPCIVAEEYIKEFEKESFDYKFFCFDGKVVLKWIDYDRLVDHKRILYTATGKRLPVECTYKSPENFPYPSEAFGILQPIAEKLAEGFPHVRVDLYYTNKKVYFGELTFYSGSGYEFFNLDKYDFKLGSYFNLPEKIV